KALPFRGLPLLPFLAATPPAVRKGSAFSRVAAAPLSGGYAARRAERLRLSGDCNSSPFWRLRRRSPRSGGLKVDRPFQAGLGTAGGARRGGTIDSSRSRGSAARGVVRRSLTVVRVADTCL